LPAPN